MLLVPSDQPTPPPPSVPSPQLLDDFNRANENPVSQNGNWWVVGVNGLAPAPLVQNQLKDFSTPGYSYRVKPYFGGEMEAGATITSRPANNEWLSVFVALQDAGTPTYDGYELRATMLNGSADRWEVIRITDGQQTTLATDYFEIASGGTMFLRRGAYRLEFWWKPPGGPWQRKLDTPELVDFTYRWGMIGAGGYRSGALDDFVGGTRLSLLNQYAPELRYREGENFRSVDAAIATDLYFPQSGESVVLKRPGPSGDTVIASPSDPQSTLSLTFLSNQAQTGDFLDMPAGTIDPITDASIQYSNWVTDLNRQNYNKIAYGREILHPTSGEKILQYWIYYYFNPKAIFAQTVGFHEGDWEMVQVRLSALGVPISSAFSQHGNGQRCNWGTAPISDSGNPVVYVASDSHANYFSTGTYPTPASPLAFDYTADSGPTWREVPRVTQVTSTSPTWIANWDGRWGGSREGETQSPRTPGFHDPWIDPWGWHDNASACGGPLPMTTYSVTAGNGRPGRTTVSVSDTAPPLPTIRSARVVSGTKYGRGLRTSYCFNSIMPPAKARWRLYIILDNPRDKLPPISIPWVVRERCDVVVQPVGGAKAPYVMRYFVQTINGTRSPTKQLRLG